MQQANQDRGAKKPSSSRVVVLLVWAQSTGKRMLMHAVATVKVTTFAQATASIVSPHCHNAEPFMLLGHGHMGVDIMDSLKALDGFGSLRTGRRAMSAANRFSSVAPYSSMPRIAAWCSA